MNRTLRAYKLQAMLSERRDRADRARALLKLAELLNDSDEKFFETSKEWSGAHFGEMQSDDELESDELIEDVDEDGTRYLWTRAEYAVALRKVTFSLVLANEREARAGIFHNSQVVLIETSPIRVVVREFLTAEACQKRLALIANKEGYHAERSWLRDKLI